MKKISKIHVLILALILLCNCKPSQNSNTVLVDPQLKAASYSTKIIELLVNKSWGNIMKDEKDSLRKVTINDVKVEFKKHEYYISYNIDSVIVNEDTVIVSSLNFTEKNWDKKGSIDNAEVIVKSKNLFDFKNKSLVNCTRLNFFINNEKLNFDAINTINCN